MTRLPILLHNLVEVVLMSSKVIKNAARNGEQFLGIHSGYWKKKNSAGKKVNRVT
jgi:hypothetical protein